MDFDPKAYMEVFGVSLNTVEISHIRDLASAYVADPVTLKGGRPVPLSESNARGDFPVIFRALLEGEAVELVRYGHGGFYATRTVRLLNGEEETVETSLPSDLREAANIVDIRLGALVAQKASPHIL
jgi:hypothetical protein